MPLVNAKCTNCGAPLEVDNEKEAAICKFCGSAFIVEKAINYYQTTIVNNFAGATIIAEDGFTKLYEAAQGYKKIEDTPNYLNTLVAITKEYPQKFEGWYGLGINDLKTSLEEIKDIYNSVPKELDKINQYNNTDKILFIKKQLEKIESFDIERINKASKVANEEQTKLLNAELEKYNNEVSNITNNLTQELQKYESLKQQAMNKLRKLFGTKEAFITYFKENKATTGDIDFGNNLFFHANMHYDGTRLFYVQLKDKSTFNYDDGQYVVKDGLDLDNLSIKSDDTIWGNTNAGHKNINSFIRFYLENIVEEENKLVLRVAPENEEEYDKVDYYERFIPRILILTVSPVKKGLFSKLFG